MNDKIEILAQKALWSGDIELLIKNDNAVVKDIIFEPVEEGIYTYPSLTISSHMAQQLMDELWVAGLRPSEGTGSAGSLAATQKHLEDMRNIAFGQLNIIKEKK